MILSWRRGAIDQMSLHGTAELLRDTLEALPLFEGRFSGLKLMNVDPVSGQKRGCFSLVFRAFDQIEQRTVAIKFYDPNASMDIYRISAFRREYEILTSLIGSERCLQLVAPLRDYALSINTGAGVFTARCEYFVVDWIDEEIDSYFLTATHSAREKLGLFLDMVLAVEALHSRSVFHRDLKADNMRAFQRALRRIVVAIDLGTAAKFDSGGIQATYGHSAGAPWYAAPEALCGLAGNRSIAPYTDYYALGCLLFELFNPDYFFRAAERYWRETASQALVVFRFELLRYATEPDLPQRFMRELSAALQKQVFVPEFTSLTSRYLRTLRGKAEFSLFGLKYSLAPSEETIDDMLAVFRDRDNGRFTNSATYAEFLGQQSTTPQFLLAQLFDVHILGLNARTALDETQLSSRACFNQDGYRNLEKYLKLIVRFLVPEPTETFVLYQRSIDRVKSETSSIKAILEEPAFRLTDSDTTHDQFWSLLVNQASNFTAPVANDAIRTLVEYLPLYSSVGRNGTSLRERSIYSLVRLLDIAGWGRTSQRRLANTPATIVEVAHRIFGTQGFEEQGVLDQMVEPARGVLGWRDLMLFRLSLSWDRGNQLYNVQSSLLLYEDLEASTTGLVSELAVQGMRRLSQEVFAHFKRTYIETGKNFFTEVAKTPNAAFFGRALGRTFSKRALLKSEEARELGEALDARSPHTTTLPPTKRICPRPLPRWMPSLRHCHCQMMTSAKAI